ncbi:MAG: hypothetical protein N2045_00990 [Fimbriimonadales bacterium]|jgi:hypothetical protein|nr:hypothetical protein [Fimbriimonadales bacterium]CUU37381.1 hypothetical protein GXSOP10_13234 [Armatimonadetes bacterium GXS]
MAERRWSTSQVEQVLRELRGVCGARVVADETGLIQEVHLLVEGDRNPKQVVRDVESALMAHFGIHIDHRKVSVAQKSGASRAAGAPRLRWVDVQISHEGTRAIVSAYLERNGQIYRGTASGVRASTQLPRLVALATLRAVEAAHGLQERFGLEEIATNWTLGGYPLVAVLVSAVRDQGEDLLLGSALVRNDLYRAVGLATLDAVNRRVQAFPSDYEPSNEAVALVEGLTPNNA